ncbi:hypothetical protein ACQ4PT_004716 [Festuca glaucescens]
MVTPGSDLGSWLVRVEGGKGLPCPGGVGRLAEAHSGSGVRLCVGEGRKSEPSRSRRGGSLRGDRLLLLISSMAIGIGEVMTVGRGDVGGDLGSPPPATDPKGAGEICSPEWLSGSCFWALQHSDEEDQGEAEEVSPLADMDKVSRYLCSTPTQVSGRDIDDSSTELARRSLKRTNRRDQQRAATKAAMALSSPEGKVSLSPLSLDKSLGKTKELIMPVMEPTVFLDDSTEGWTVVRRRRWPPAIGKKALDPRNMGNSNFPVLGLARLRANSKTNMDRHGPFLATIRSSDATRSNGDRKPRQARVGDSIAGRAFRNILGLAWRKIESGEPVVRRQAPVIILNGDGGQGGFNPGRGGFSAGRGGYQGRGGFQGHGAFQGRGYQGRGANAARGRQMGNVRGGHGYGATRGGYQSNARNNTYSNGNNFGYGGNQQRWQATRGGGFQQRATDNGAGIPARTGIDADLLHQTVQAVVAAVTAATKVPESTQVAVGSDAMAGGTGQHAGMSVAAPNAIPQQTPIQEVQDPQIAGAKGKENEGQGPQKKKKEDKQGCFRCKQPGHYIDDLRLFVIYVSQFIMQLQLVTFCKLQSPHQLYMDMQMRLLCFLSFLVVLSRPR